MAYTTIDKPTDYFNTVLYTGNGTAIGSGGLAVTGVGFQPDWVWLKNRTTGDRSHQLYDVVRGVTKGLKTNSTDEENTNSERLTAFGSDGFTVGNNQDVNTSGNAHVSWNWKAGTSFSNDASATSVGTIDSTGSINTTAGFSIISYTGTGSAGTVAHGLASTPQAIIIKNRTDSSSSFWGVYHHSSFVNASDPNVLYLNSTGAASDDTNVFGTSTTFNSTVFSVGDYNGSNGSSDNIIAYCFAEKQGYSKFGSYTGNGNANGTFIYTGFKPAWVVIKRSSASGNNWVMYDNKRDVHNVVHHRLHVDLSNAEVDTSSSTVNNIDFLSNGIKIRNSGGAWNNSGDTFIYMCFAESPFVNSNGVPNNAG